jgi:iron complex outermembrane receptor protein
VKLKLTALLFIATLTVFANNPMKIKVLDENNEPVIGAKVILPSVEAASFTDFDGESDIVVTAESKITVEFIGYEPQEVAVPMVGDEVVIVLRKRVPSQAL